MCFVLVDITKTMQSDGFHLSGEHSKKMLTFLTINFHDTSFVAMVSRIHTNYSFASHIISFKCVC